MLLFASLIFVPHAAQAQQSADIIRGRVVGPDSQPIGDVLITALSYVGGIQKQKRTDKNGRYTIVFPNGEGDYWLQFNTIGFVSRRFEVKRHSDEDVLVANATLSKSQELNAVQVSAAGGKLSLSRNDNFQDVSGSDQSITAGFVVVSPGARGDLVAQASALPGVQFIPGVDGAPDRFSIFGLSDDQNNTTLNGSQQGISKLPREANTSLQLRTGYDVSTGGASGATVAIITNSGTNRAVRPLSLVLSPPQTQLPGPLGASSRYGAVSASGRMTGPWRWDRDFYNVSFQFDHRQQDLLNVGSGARDALTAAGVANDSVPSLLNALSTAHIPYNAGGTGSNTASDAGSFLGTFDWASKSAASGQALTLTTNAGFNVRGPNALSLTSTPSSLISSKSLNGGLQLRHTNFFGSGTLTESVFSISASRFNTDPEFRAPSASVIVSSAFDDDSTFTTRALSIGGSSSASTSTTFTAGARNILSRLSENNRHRTKLTSEFALLSNGDEQEGNSLGTFSYRSLDDLASNRASSFSRTIGSTDVSARAIIGGLALGDSWRPSGNLQLQYGLRVEADQFLTRPVRNALLETELGVRNDRLPSNVYFSPRIGFSKTILDSHSFLYGVQEEYETENSTLSGGIGLFQNTRGPDLISPILAQTGLTEGSTTVSCVGSTTPVPDWQSYLASESTIPSTCANGSATTALGSTVPTATLFSRNFVEPRSMRASLRFYTERLNGHRTTLAVTYAYNLNQLGSQDINLRAARQFSLPDEGGRNVYVAPSSIDAASGFTSISENRISPSFGAVRELQSNLHSQSATFSFTDIRLGKLCTGVRASSCEVVAPDQAVVCS